MVSTGLVAELEELLEALVSVGGEIELSVGEAVLDDLVGVAGAAVELGVPDCSSGDED